MLHEYIIGITIQLERRAKELRRRIRRELPRDYDALAQKCRDCLDAVLRDLRCIRDEYSDTDSEAARLRHLRRAASDLAELETIAIVALDRAQEDDHYLNALLYEITREIKYPLITPVVTTLSSEYFHIYPNFNLMCVPLSEGRFLLHLPDLYHELAHPLLIIRDEPSIEPFQKSRDVCLMHVLEYLVDERTKALRRREPEALCRNIDLWEISWLRGWLDEFLCDLFAVYTLGPAYAWSHLHLSMIRGQDPFVHFPTHPADDARMRCMLHGLALSGFQEHAGVIEERWNAFLVSRGAKTDPEYRQCFPAHLVAQIASDARRGVADMQCRMAAPSTADAVHTGLNSAWTQFWSDPREYAAWEEERVLDWFQQRTSNAGVLLNNAGATLAKRTTAK
jgi:hypothetical protein